MKRLVQRWGLVPAAVAAAVLGTAGAVVIPLPGGAMAVKDPVDGAARVPEKWVLSKGTESDCKVWQRESGSGFLLKAGAVLETTVAVPVLGEKEEKVARDWLGIAHLDYLGASTDGGGHLSLQVRIGEVLLAGRTGAVGTPVRERGGEDPEAVVRRLWVVVEADRMREGLGKEVTLRVANPGPGGVVVTGVGFCRVPTVPSKKLLGKANGHLGPDLLGAGSLGFEALTEHRQGALQVIGIRGDGPAAQAGLEPGDVILEVNRRPLPENDLAPGWGWWEHSHEAVLGRAVVQAGSRKGMVELGILRGNDLQRVAVRVPRSMAFGSLIPEEDARAAALYEDTLAFLVRTQRPDGSWSGDPIRTTFSALALLATRDATHAERVKGAVDYLLHRFQEAENFGNLGFWHAAYAGILYSEYHLATGDRRVLPRLAEIRDWVLTGTHTSKWGMPALGHGIGHLPYGQKALMAPLAHLVVYEALAARAGVESAIWEELWPFIEHSWSDPAKKDGRGRAGHGAMGYNASYKDLGEFWSRSGLCAMACHLRGERSVMRDALTAVMRERHPWIRNSHAYGEPGGAWGLLALNLCAPESYREVIKAYDWWFALAWEPGYGLRFTTPHMGAPYMGTDDLLNAAYALVLAGPRRSLHLSGATDRGWLDVANLPTPVSEVRVKRSREGLVRLEGRLPGPEVRYTLDGTEPDAQGRKYEGPFRLAEAATLKARVVSTDGTLGPVRTVEFGPAKGKWQVVAASGHAKVGEALRRADRVIDGDLHKCWLTDTGEGSEGYPHFVVVDLGAVVEVNSLTLHLAQKGTAPGKWKVQVASEADAAPLTVAEGEWSEFATRREIAFGEPARARFLRFEAISGMTDGASALMVRELEVR